MIGDLWVLVCGRNPVVVPAKNDCMVFMLLSMVGRSINNAGVGMSQMFFGKVSDFICAIDLDRATSAGLNRLIPAVPHSKVLIKLRREGFICFSIKLF